MRLNKIMLKKIVSVATVLFYVNFGFCNYAQAQSGMQPNTVQCTLTDAPTCTDNTPCKNINGVTYCLAGNSTSGTFYNLPQSCWTTQKNYSCLTKSNDCFSLQTNGACSENAGSPQCARDANGNPMTNSYGCSVNTHTYTCTTTPGSTNTTTSCSPSLNLNGLTWASGAGTGTADFIKAVTGREIQNQVAEALRQGLSLFPGEGDQCQIKLGFQNCCTSNSGSGGGTNQQIAQTLGLSAAGAALKTGASYAANMGSPYVYDALMNNGAEGMASTFANTMSLGIGDTGRDAVGNLGGGGFGAFGFGTTQASAEGMVGSLGGSSVTGSTMVFTTEGNFGLASSMAGGALEGQTAVLYFNPYALAAAVAIMVVMAYLSCDASDVHTQALVNKNLCHYVGSYCSQKIPVLNICLTTKQSYCCYNGLLAKDIQEGAHAQLGLSWGSPESPQCGGLTIDQILGVDFSAVNFSDFQAQIQQSAVPLGTDAMNTMQNKVSTKLSK